MIENAWTILPFPYSELATEKPLNRREAPNLFNRLLEDGVGLAGVLAAAAAYPEVDQGDIRSALRLLAEHMHSALALWDAWQEGEAPGKEDEG
jgi:hypothetical protein